MRDRYNPQLNHATTWKEGPHDGYGFEDEVKLVHDKCQRAILYYFTDWLLILSLTTSIE